MPTYDYICNHCGHHFEELQSIKAESLTDCPKCNKPTLRRRLGAGAGVIFKGNGFYLTDYKKNGSSPAKSDSADTTAPEKKPAETIPAAAKPAADKPSTDKSSE